MHTMAESLDQIESWGEERANRALVGVVHGGFGHLDWYDQAACRNRDSRLWFSSYRRTIDGAIAVCHRCPVRPACLALAMDHPELVGVWGGTDEVDRARARREKRRKAR